MDKLTGGATHTDPDIYSINGQQISKKILIAKVNILHLNVFIKYCCIYTFIMYL